MRFPSFRMRSSWMVPSASGVASAAFTRLCCWISGKPLKRLRDDGDLEVVAAAGAVLDLDLDHLGRRPRGGHGSRSQPSAMMLAMAGRVAFVVSLPERTVRSLFALAGGGVHETAELVLPRLVRRSRLYEATAKNLLRVSIELVGGVEAPTTTADEYEPDARKLAVRKTAGNAVELGWIPPPSASRRCGCSPPPPTSRTGRGCTSTRSCAS